MRRPNAKSFITEENNNSSSAATQAIDYTVQFIVLKMKCTELKGCFHCTYDYVYTIVQFL